MHSFSAVLEFLHITILLFESGEIYDARFQLGVCDVFCKLLNLLSAKIIDVSKGHAVFGSWAYIVLMLVHACGSDLHLLSIFVFIL